jgi:hypothetical protein
MDERSMKYTHAAPYRNNILLKEFSTQFISALEVTGPVTTFTISFIEYSVVTCSSLECSLYQQCR